LIVTVKALSKSATEGWIEREIAAAAVCVRRQDSERNTYSRKDKITTRFWRDKRNLIF